MPERRYGFPEYPEDYRIIYSNLGIRPKKRYLSDRETRELLKGEVVLEEKLDGSTIFITWTGGKPLLRAKGTRLISEYEKKKAFVHAYNWAYQNCEKLEKIPHGYAIVGEWLYAMKSIPYNELPDFFVAFDVMEIKTGKVLDFERKLKIIEDCGLARAPVVHIGKVTYDELPEFVRLSAFSSRHTEHEKPFDEAQIMEGIVAKNYNKGFKNGKYVTKEFTDAMEQDWLKLPLVVNRLKSWSKES